MLRSPGPCAATRPISVSILKPLPGRPRSFSLPSTPEPVELPGSILLDNQGFPYAAADDLAYARPISQNVRRSTHPLVNDIEDDEDFSELLKLFPEPLTEPLIHAKSVPDLGHQHNKMRSDGGGNTLNLGAVHKPSPLKVQHKKSLSETSSRRSSRPNLITSTLSTDSKLATCLTPTVDDNSNISARAQIGASQTLQPSPLILEGQAWNSNAEHRVNRRADVSTICFRDIVCLFVKQDAVHNETVSEHLFLSLSSSDKTFRA